MLDLRIVPLTNMAGLGWHSRILHLVTYPQVIVMHMAGTH